MIQLKGIAAAGGISIGPVYKLGSEELVVLRQTITWDEIPLQIQLFEEALIKTAGRLSSCKKE